MTSSIVTLGTAETAKELTETICALYQAVFSQPPFHWNEDEPAEHRRRLERLRNDPTFGITTAHMDDELVGFAYGVALKPDTKWWDGAIEPLPEELTTEWAGRSFAVIDLAVREDQRRKGVGRELLHVLLGSRSEERATLAVQPEAAETQIFYQHLGWQKAGRIEGASGDSAPWFDLYVLPLTPRL
jgi:ribosomal protein S18 acetylase RimI-like enzyme